MHAFQHFVEEVLRHHDGYATEVAAQLAVVDNLPLTDYYHIVGFHKALFRIYCIARLTTQTQSHKQTTHALRHFRHRHTAKLREEQQVVIYTRTMKQLFGGTHRYFFYCAIHILCPYDLVSCKYSTINPISKDKNKKPHFPDKEMRLLLFFCFLLPLLCLKHGLGHSTRLLLKHLLAIHDNDALIALANLLAREVVHLTICRCLAY